MRSQPIDHLGDDKAEVQRDADGKRRVVARRCMHMAVPMPMPVAVTVPVFFVMVVIVWHGVAEIRPQGPGFPSGNLPAIPMPTAARCKGADGLCPILNVAAMKPVKTGVSRSLSGLNFLCVSGCLTRGAQEVRFTENSPTLQRWETPPTIRHLFRRPDNQTENLLDPTAALHYTTGMPAPRTAFPLSKRKESTFPSTLATRLIRSGQSCDK